MTTRSLKPMALSSVHFEDVEYVAIHVMVLSHVTCPFDMLLRTGSCVQLFRELRSGGIWTGLLRFSLHDIKYVVFLLWVSPVGSRKVRYTCLHFGLVTAGDRCSDSFLLAGSLVSIAQTNLYD